MFESAKWLERTELLINKASLEKLANTHVLLVGLGGVGSFAAEFLVRAGIGRLCIVDGDVVDSTNINRQLPALHSTVAQSKAILMRDRLLDINPQLELMTINQFLQPDETTALVNAHAFDYVLDCIDSITPKIYLIKAAMSKGCKLISSMGAGGKTDTMLLKYADISKTNMCPFAYYLRKRLRKEGIRSGFMTVYSEESPNRESIKMTDGSNFKTSFYGTISYIPALFGLHIAAYVIQDATGTFAYTKACTPKAYKDPKA
ncbi:MAG TPA: tRNA threonylcarbamoyladenosine dehydratase [Chitinophagaceae bacterium]|nr:tRNA threonylcarbamoyladenosine dehydratase [Chitinophagaceae bacterium]